MAYITTNLPEILFTVPASHRGFLVVLLGSEAGPRASLGAPLPFRSLLPVSALRLAPERCAVQLALSQ